MGDSGRLVTIERWRRIGYLISAPPKTFRLIITDPFAERERERYSGDILPLSLNLVRGRLAGRALIRQSG